MTDKYAWVKLVPVLEKDGTRWAWRLELYLDVDWQEYTIEGGSGSTKLSIQLTDELIPSIIETLQQSQEGGI